jgi:hypothetical protein
VRGKIRGVRTLPLTRPLVSLAPDLSPPGRGEDVTRNAVLGPSREPLAAAGLGHKLINGIPNEREQ